jgi:hypothetical protein
VLGVALDGSTFRHRGEEARGRARTGSKDWNCS